MVKKAFFLLSFSLYLACIVLLIYLFFPFLFNCQHQIQEGLQKTLQLQKFNTMVWSLVNIVEDAPGELHSFKYFEKSVIVWNEGTKDYGLIYHHRKKALYNIQGIFDENTKKWKLGKKILIGQAVVEFSYNKSPFYIICSFKEASLMYAIYSKKKFYRTEKI